MQLDNLYNFKCNSGKETYKLNKDMLLLKSKYEKIQVHGKKIFRSHTTKKCNMKCPYCKLSSEREAYIFHS